jgi:hypothetical protein
VENYSPTMSEEFRETSTQSIWALAKHIAAIADVLKQELPFDSLTASCHVEDGTDDFTIGILARWGGLPLQHHDLYALSRCAAGAKRSVSRKLLCRRYASRLFRQGVAARDFGDLWNIGALDGALQRQMGSAVSFVRGISDGDKPSGIWRLA